MQIQLTRLPGTGRREKHQVYAQAINSRIVDQLALIECVDGLQESHFRGRKLKGQEVKVPAGWKGVVVKDRGVLPQKHKQEGHGDGEDGDESEEEGEVKILEELGGFEEIVVWGHESVGEPGEDVFVRGMEEWVGFSGAVSTCPSCYLEVEG